MAKCQGFTAQGSRCKRNATIGNFCASHQDQAESNPKTATPPQNLPVTSPEIHTTTALPEIQTTTIDMPCDRMLRYRKSPPCPRCGAHPVVCKLRKQDYALFRCRVCGHRFEVDRRVDRTKEYVSGKEGNILFKMFRKAG